MTRSRDVADTQDNLGGAVAPYVAGKNKIINGDFGVNQRSFTSTTSTGDFFGFDRWFSAISDGTVTYSAQTFTAGDDFPEAAVEGTNFARLVSTGQTLATAEARICQRIEDVRTFADKTITVSFWAKASTGTPNIAVDIAQIFGTGGSTSVIAASQKFPITSSWARYSKTFVMPSLSGKTIGTGSNLRFNLWTSAGSNRNSQTDSLGIQSITVDFWGVQIEAGSVATPFTTASGSIGGELTLCQRYYTRFGSPYITNINETFGTGNGLTTTSANIVCAFPVQMRVAPTAVDFSTIRVTDMVLQGDAVTSVTLSSTENGRNAGKVQAAISPANLTVNRMYFISANGSTNGFIGFSAEL